MARNIFSRLTTDTCGSPRVVSAYLPEKAVMRVSVLYTSHRSCNSFITPSSRILVYLFRAVRPRSARPCSFASARPNKLTRMIGHGEINGVCRSTKVRAVPPIGSDLFDGNRNRRGGQPRRIGETSAQVICRISGNGGERGHIRRCWTGQCRRRYLHVKDDEGW